MGRSGDNRFIASGEGPYFQHTVREDEMREQIAQLHFPYYVYALCEPNGVGFYIGKGCGDRVFDHAKEARRGFESNKCDVIRSLGEKIRYSLFLCCGDEKYALMMESIMIDQHWDCLTNAAKGMTMDAIDRIPEDNNLLRAMKSAEDGIRICDEIIAKCRRSAAALVKKHPSVRHILFPEANHGASV